MSVETDLGRERTTRRTARGRPEAVDADPRRRPGVPMEAEPMLAGAAIAAPERQRIGEEHFHRAGIDRLTPVFGTAQPPRGLSGWLRRRAYRVGEHRARHWAMLLAADRVDVMEGRLGRCLGGAVRATGAGRAAARIERNPWPTVGVLAALAVAAGLAVRAARRR
jgi:hypothetical protein